MKDVLNGTETEPYYAHDFYEPAELSQMLLSMIPLALNVMSRWSGRTTETRAGTRRMTRLLSLVFHSVQ